MNFEAALQKKIDLINGGLDDYLPMVYPEIINEAARYSIFPGGKRLRPVILLATCKMLGGKTANALPFACALEMIHTYSLIHDDLPAMDNDDLRRGHPTNHMVFGEAMAILAGDALLNRAYEVMAQHCVANPNIHFLKAMSKIADYAGIKGMIGGQVMDIRMENAAATAQELEYIYTNKTSGLLMAAFGGGALAAFADDDTVSTMEDIGKTLGMAFQIKDDLLDISGGETLGKPIGSDQKNQKSTYISLYGVEKAEEMYHQLSASVIESLRRLENSAFLVALAENLIDRTR